MKDEHAHKVVAPRVPYDVEIGHPSVGIDDLPVIHCQEAPIYLTLLALHAEARVDIQTTSSGRPGPSSPPALCREQSSYASRCTHSAKSSAEAAARQSVREASASAHMTSKRCERLRPPRSGITVTPTTSTSPLADTLPSSAK